MLNVILTKGLPASGKSTWAKKMVDDNPNQYKRVNKDDLRDMLDNSKFSKDSEKFILKVRDAIILEALGHGKHVIVDDTNLSEKHFERIKQLVHGKAAVKIKDFTDIPIEVCIQRDLKRLNSVGETRIREMYNQSLRKVVVYDEDANLPPAILVDMDGTLALMNGRSPFDWAKVGEDAVNEPVRTIVNSYRENIIIMSGRDEVCRHETISWLNRFNIKFNKLYMRPQGNQEKDSIIKRRLFEENIRGKYYIEFVVDDRRQVVQMWREELGLTCFQVAEGNF